MHFDRNDKKRVKVICRRKTPVFSEANEASGPSANEPSGAVKNTSKHSGPVKNTNEASG